MESKVKVWKPPQSIKNYAAPCESMAKSIRSVPNESKCELESLPPAYSSCTSSSTDGSESIRGIYTDFCFRKDNPVEYSDENQRYVAYIERLKEFIFPGSLNFGNLSPRLRNFAVYVDEELFELQREKNKILRRQGELLYMLQDAVLEDDCTRLRNDMNQLSKISDEQKTPRQRQREGKLINEIINIVCMRNNIFEDMHIERLRDIEEEEEMTQAYNRRKKEWISLLASSNGTSFSGSSEKFESSKMKNKMRYMKNGCILL